jgi:hypothetical protein
MGLLRKLTFWKKRKHNTSTKMDACVSTEVPRTCDAATVSTDLTVMCDAYTQVETRIPTKDDACVSTEVPRTCDAATVSTDLTVMCDSYTQVETNMDGGATAVAKVYESELQIKIQKIRELEEELAVSKRLTADLMLTINSVEQQVRKYAEEPVSRWSDDCECKQQVSAVADLLKNFVITESDAENSKQPEATSRRNTKVDCATQTKENSRKRDRTNKDMQEKVRRLKRKKRKLSALVEEYQRESAVLNEKIEHMLQDRTSHTHITRRYEEDNQRLLLKIRDMRDELLWYKEKARTSEEIRGDTKRHKRPPTEKKK